MTRHGFADLATAAYCPRKLYYRRRDGDWDPPPVVADRRAIAMRYEALLADPARLAAAPIAVSPGDWRSAIERARAEPWWDAVAAPADSDVLVTGRRCRGVVHKLIELDGPAPSIVSAGRSPDVGVWEPDAVRAVAAAKALAWAREAVVERAFVEYPASGVIRPVRLTTRRKATYRRVLRTVESLDGPPPRLRSASKCDACEYRSDCGVRTRTLKSLLG